MKHRTICYRNGAPLSSLWRGRPPIRKSCVFFGNVQHVHRLASSRRLRSGPPSRLRLDDVKPQATGGQSAAGDRSRARRTDGRATPLGLGQRLQRLALGPAPPATDPVTLTSSFLRTTTYPGRGPPVTHLGPAACRVPICSGPPSEMDPTVPSQAPPLQPASIR
jgi:hypothetical protein